MLDLEKVLVKTIAYRFKKLRGNTPANLISSQKSAINRIENEINTKSGNFVTETLLDEYTDYFGKEKSKLIFGSETDIENILYFMFQQIYLKIIPTHMVKTMRYPFNSDEFQDDIDTDIIETFRKIFFIFGDYSRWYKIRKDQNDPDQNIDCDSMFQIIWLLLKNKIITSFKIHVIEEICNKSHKFLFSNINGKFNLWYRKQFMKIIIPEALEKLQSDSIFKIGLMVNHLIDDFYEDNLPQSYLEDVPLEEFFMPVKRYHISTPANNSKEENKKIAEEMFRMLTINKTIKNRKDIEELDKLMFFKEIESVTDLSTPFVNEVRQVSAANFLDKILETPEIFNSFHGLNDRDRKIPGLLSVNSQASKLFQYKANEAILKQIDDLIRYQNRYINLIKWDELSSFL